MKKIIGLILCLLLVSLCAFALADVAINKTNFPDEHFRDYVKEHCDADGNGSLSSNEIAAVDQISVGRMEISTLKGIKYFSALTYLICSDNNLTELDVSSNTALTRLECSYNQLDQVDVSKNTLLTYLHFQGNNLTSLDVRKNSKLINLYCGDNQLTSLKLGNQQYLDNISCRHNKLTALDISGCPKLENLLSVGEFGYYEPDGRNYFGWWIPEPDRWPASCLFVDRGISLITTSGTIRTDESTSVTSITLNKTKATLTRTSDKKKPTLQLTAEVGPEDATNQSVEWTSSNPKIAKVDENGKVTALKKGTAVITCAAKDGSGVKAECKITVKDKLVSKITLNKKKVTIKLGKTFQLKVTKLSPANALNQKVTWKSSNTKIATVDKNGKVKAKKKGTCAITCTAKDGSGKKVTCKVTVK